MNDLISRAALLDEFRSLCGPQTGDGWDNMGVRNLIMRQKAVDAAPVVRCRDCKHWEMTCTLYEIRYGYCNNMHNHVSSHRMPEENYYCPHGERRENE